MRLVTAILALSLVACVPSGPPPDPTDPPPVIHNGVWAVEFPEYGYVCFQSSRIGGIDCEPMLK